MHTNAHESDIKPECTTTNTMLSSAMDLAPLVLIRVAWCPLVVSCRFVTWRLALFLHPLSFVRACFGFELRISDLIASEPESLCLSVSSVVNKPIASWLRRRRRWGGGAALSSGFSVTLL